MSRDAWHEIADGATRTLARRMPPRFDVAARTALPDAPRGRVARQIRQDLWRALAAVRGFSPVVSVTRAGGRLDVVAGGRIEARGYSRADIEARIAGVLAAPARRRRWIDFARRGGCCD